MRLVRAEEELLAATPSMGKVELQLTASRARADRRARLERPPPLREADRRCGRAGADAARSGAPRALGRLTPRRTLELLGPLRETGAACTCGSATSAASRPATGTPTRAWRVRRCCPGRGLASHAGRAWPETGAAAYERELADVVLDLACSASARTATRPRCSPAHAALRPRAASSACGRAQAAAGTHLADAPDARRRPRAAAARQRAGKAGRWRRCSANARRRCRRRCSRAIN